MKVTLSFKTWFFHRRLWFSTYKTKNVKTTFTKIPGYRLNIFRKFQTKILCRKKVIKKQKCTVFWAIRYIVSVCICVPSQKLSNEFYSQRGVRLRFWNIFSQLSIRFQVLAWGKNNFPRNLIESVWLWKVT